MLTRRRDSWRFGLSISALRAAALKKRTFHEERHAYWKAQVEALKTELPTSIDVPDLMELASSYSNSSRAYGGVQIDARLQQKLTEAFNKVKEHAGRVDEFKRWKRFLALAPDEGKLELTYEDATFFAL